MRSMRFRFAQLCLVASLLLASMAAAAAHSMGNNKNELTEPVKEYFAELERLQKDFKGSAPVLRGALYEFKLWTAGDTLSLCFFDGDPQLKQFFVDTSRVWLEGTSLKLDFGPPPAYRRCDPSKPDDIRVSFTQPGNSSFVGTDSLKVNLKAPSLSIGESMGRFDTLDRPRLRELILHEFGHALGLEHEHQSPEAKCDEEFDWDRIYPYARAQWGWEKGKVDHNMGALVVAPRLRTTPYDPQSIMHYTFNDWMFKHGKDFRCFVSQAETASVTDLAFVRAAYPVQVNLQDDRLQQKATALGSALAASRLDTEQLAKVGTEIGGVTLVRLKRLDEALGELRRATELAPEQARYAYVYAVALHSAGRPSEAITQLSESLARHPDDRDTLTAIISFSRDAGDPRTALNYAERLARMAPADQNIAGLIQDLRQRVKNLEVP